MGFAAGDDDMACIFLALFALRRFGFGKTALPESLKDTDQTSSPSSSAIKDLPLTLVDIRFLLTESRWEK